MPDDEAVTAARESAVGDQRDLAAETLADDGARRTQHFAHTGPALRAFVADHDDVAGFYLAAEDPLQRVLLRVEDARPAGEAQSLFACNFCNGALRREIAVQNHQVTILLDRAAQGP